MVLTGTAGICVSRVQTLTILQADFQPLTQAIAHVNRDSSQIKIIDVKYYDVPC